jgi:hypothetical protein
MAINLLDLFTTTYNESLLRQATHALGESADSVIAGIDIGAKTVLAGIVSKAGSKGGVNEWVYGAMPADWPSLTHINTDDIFIQPNLDHFTTAGASILQNLFGGKQNDVIDYVSGHARLKTSSSSTLLKVIAPLLIRTIADYREETSLGRMDTRNILNEQAAYLHNALPIDLQTLLTPAETPPQQPSASDSPDYAVPPDSPMHVSKLLPWIILLITALGLFYFVEKGCGSKTPAVDENKEMEVDSTKLDSI